MNGGVTDPHRRQRIDAALREVLRHSFHDPQRHQLQIEAPPVVDHARRDVELEDVDQLVADDMVVLGVVAGEREDDAVHERIGEAAGAFADELGSGGGLLEVGGVGVDDDRFARERVVEHAREPLVPALGLAPDVVHHVRFAVVVVDVEVLGLEHLEVEVLPLNFVASEVLRVGGKGCERENEDKGQCDSAHQ